MARKKQPARNEGSSRKRRRNKPGERPRARSAFGRTLYWLAVLFAWSGLAAVGAAVYVVLTVQSPDVFQMPQRERGIVVLASDGQVLAYRGVFQGDQVRIDELPDYVPDAVVAIEDRRFHGHFGVDPIGLARALFVNLSAGQIVQGGSTLSQQLAKNLFLEPERTVKRKLQELVLALWLEYQYSKDEILQLYLNRVYFGGGAYGVEAAAQRFFGKSARDVTLAEAAMLAGVLKAPSRYAPTSDRKLAEDRAFLVLEAMVDTGAITAREGQLAVDNPAALTRTPNVSSRQYVVDWIFDIVPSFVASHQENLVVHTTIDREMQDAAEQVLRARMDAAGSQGGASQAAIVLMAPTGEIRALVGGVSYAQSQYNRAVQARRQPGSAFKPFVYLTALEHGFTPDTERIDQPITVGGWTPANYGGRYYGRVTLRDALARSLNSVAVQLARDVGPAQVIERAQRLGIHTELQNNLSIALGTSEVSLIELTGAYASFANGGYGVLPHVITEITTLRGDTVYRRDGSGAGRVVSQTNVGFMNDMLSAVVAQGTGGRAALERHPAAGKTGTTQDSRDAWFVGYTASLVAGVWTGNDDGRPMRDVTGGGLPTMIWHDLMTRAHVGLPAAPLPGGGEAAAPMSIVELLRDLSVATIQDLIGGGAASRGAPQPDGSYVDQITDNPR
jgi:penicillin-binding protein 1A